MALATCIAFGYALEAGEVRPSAGVIEPKVIALGFYSFLNQNL